MKKTEMITADLTGNLGNHMWQYAITRLAAEQNGYGWGFNRTPSHDYHSGANQMDFMNIDFGKEHQAAWGEIPGGVDKIWKEKYIKFSYENGDTVDFHPFQPEVFDIEDGTKLVIRCCQNEQYIKGKKEDIRKWFEIKDEKALEYGSLLEKNKIFLDDNLCVINVRGGEYKGIPNVLLVQKYWNDAINHMVEKNHNMEFIVITEDVDYAKSIFNFPVHHFSIGMDYYIVNHASHLILSNSSFALFPAWLNQNSKTIIAPKYWARHNVSTGYWAASNVFMKGWNYLDRDGKMFSYEDVVLEEKTKGRKNRKVYDAILFFNELDLLEIRLNTLNDLVDYFIISESTKTHSGLPKPLYFNENKDRFKKFEHKIVHQIIDDTPDDYLNLSESMAKDEYHRLVIEKVNRGDWWSHDVPSYGRDTYEKESILRAMKNCNPEDIIIFSDADEIPNPEVLGLILRDFDPKEIYNFKQKMYFYYFNCQKEDNWIGNTLLTFEKFINLSFSELRMRRRGIFVEDGGWHFSFMGGAERIKQKVEAYSHQDFNTEQVKTNIKKSVDACIYNNHDLFNNPCNFWVVPIDDTYPKYIVNNIDKFEEYIRKPDKQFVVLKKNVNMVLRSLPAKGKSFIGKFKRKLANIIKNKFSK